MGLNFTLFCTDGTANLWGIFDTTIAPYLLYYSYVPILILSFSIGLFIYLKDRNNLLNKTLFALTFVFSLYILNELLLWTSTPVSVQYFGWTISIILRLLILLSALNFVYLYITKDTSSYGRKLFYLLLSLPLLILLPTSLTISKFDVDWCGPEYEIMLEYLYLLEFLSVSYLIGVGIKKMHDYKTRKTSHLLQSIYLLFGTAIFLALFFISDVVGEIYGLYEINLIGPIGMLCFVGTLAFLIVKYRAFNTKLIASQVLVMTLWLLIGSLLFVVKSPTSRIISTLTLILAVIGGYFLIKSVKKEVKQREEIELLAKQLQSANERLKVLDKMKSEFVSIASHQLRGPLTSIRGYASMLSEGSYGKLPQKAQDVLDKISDSAKFMALSVEDYLNVSRIEAGNMKYEMTDFNLRDLTEKIVDEMRPVAMKKGLVMVFRSDCTGSCLAHADIGKTRQVIMNLIDNAMKYTPKGTITAVVHDDLKKKKLFVKIQDTGVGMSHDTLEDVFDKFVRAKNANQINVTGTGLGLYVAKKMTEEMAGKIWAESEGEGRGSTFIIEFPIIPGKSMR